MASCTINDIVPEGSYYEPISCGRYKVTEGIVWNYKENYLIFSDMTLGTVFRWDPETYVTTPIKFPSNINNGNCYDAEWRIISCEHATSRVTRMEHDGRWIKILASHYEGKELNSPNDVIVDRKNRIWFTDPMFGRTSPLSGIKREPELDFRGVFRIDTDGSLHLVADDFVQPNGLCMDLDESHLYVNDTERRHIRRFRVTESGELTDGELFADIDGDADGMKIDIYGRVYCTGRGGIHVFEPTGEFIGVIPAPEYCRNFCFGNEDGSMLYIACSSAIYRVQTKTRGARTF